MPSRAAKNLAHKLAKLKIGRVASDIADNFRAPKDAAYADKARKFVLSARSMGMRSRREGNEIIAYPKK